MSWSYVSMGITASSSLTAFDGNLPSTYSTGDLLLALVSVRLPTETITSVTSGDGGAAYTLLYGEPDGGLYLYGRIATASESAPYVTRSGTNRAIIQTAAVRDSNGVTDFGSIVHASADSDVANNTSATITYPSLTVTLDDTLVIYAMTKNKGTDEETLVDQISGFTEINDYRPNYATSLVTVWEYQIQTTAANITGGTAGLSPWTGLDTTNNRVERAIAVALLSSSATTIAAKASFYSMLRRA